MMKNLLITALAFSIAFSPLSAYAQEAMSSGAYKIQSDSVNFAGGLSQSASYSLEDTAGELASGISTSTNYTALQGYEFMQLDIIAPSAPAGIAAEALSSSEIEVTWDEATDDFGVDRYYVYRDGARVADVANFPRNYVDTSLVPHTVYTYNVSAVDAAGNEGPWSATTTARTFMLPIPGGAPTPGMTGITIGSWSVTANDTNAIISFNTSAVLKVRMDWGRTQEYADGSLTHDFNSSHIFLLENLRPSTLYYVRVALIDGYDRETIYYLTFRTSAVALANAPANVTDFKAAAGDLGVELSWELPNDSRVVGVRIVRRDDFYPTSPTDGTAVFENADASGIEQFVDATAVNGESYYYAIFTRDLAGNFSSGVLAATGADPLGNIIAAGSVDPKIAKLTLKNFLFIQSGNSVPVENDLVSIVGNENLTVALRSHHLPPVLKTVAVSMVTADYQRFTFILRPNRDNTRYEATVASLGDPTVYTLHLDILDFANNGLKSLKGTLAVVIGEVIAVLFDERNRKFYMYLAFAVAIASAYVWFNRRKHGDLKIIKEEPWTVLAQRLAQDK